MGKLALVQSGSSFNQLKILAARPVDPMVVSIGCRNYGQLFEFSTQIVWNYC